jgi:hypothetical protein
VCTCAGTAAIRRLHHPTRRLAALRDICAHCEHHWPCPTALALEHPHTIHTEEEPEMVDDIDFYRPAGCPCDDPRAGHDTGCPLASPVLVPLLPPTPRRRTLIDTAAAAALVGVDPSTVRRWVSEGRLCRYGTRNRILVDADETRELALLLRAQRAATA